MTRLHWERVRRELELLLAQVDGGRAPDLLAFAKGFARLAEAYHAAIVAEGQTSMRIEGVRRLLDLKTPKSAIQAFLEKTKDTRGAS